MSEHSSAATSAVQHQPIGRSFAFAAITIACQFLCAESALSNNVDGTWSSVETWPLITVHSALTPDGRVLTYGTNGDGKQTGYFIYDVWDPSAGLTGGHFTLSNMTLTDIFCSSQIILPQTGEILIAGGDNWTGTGTTNTGNNNSNIFEYGSNTLARSANMNRSRWYSSSTALINGDIYIQGGSGGADFPEVRSTDGTFRLLSGAATGGYAALFPRNFLAPDGRIFGYDTNGNMYFVTTAGTGSLSAAGQYNSASAGWTSGAAMYRPGEILQMGAGGVVSININGPQPVVTTLSPMSSPRRWVSATVLADGKVLGTGGSEVENQLTNVNTTAEIWDPASQQWHVGSPGALARLYHSAALLLPDARVLVSGGGAPGPLNNTNAEIYSPPYLFDGNGDLAVRPEILSAPDTVEVGDSLPVEVDGPVTRVTLVKSGSVTHSVNMDQRFLDLPFSESGNMLQVDLPQRATDTPPGYYLMFAINTAGVPSQAHMLRVNIDSTPDTSVNYTPTIGGGGGAAFRLSCPADEIIAGVYGKFATYVNQIGPQCVKVDQLGRWIGNPVKGSLTGSTTTGTSFEKICPGNYAVSGFRGNSAQYVDQIEVQCRALTASGGLTGTPIYLGGAGGTGGSPQGPFSCGTNNPVYALYGRSGGWMDNFGMECKQAVITPISINSTPVVVNPGAQNSVLGTSVSLQISASDGDLDPLTYSATGLPAGLTINTVSGLISGIPTAANVFNASVTATDGTGSDTENFVWTIASAAPLAVDPMPQQLAIPVNTPVSYEAITNGGVNVQHKWDFGDGTPETAYSSSATATHTFVDAGVYFVTLTVVDDANNPEIQSFAQRVHLPLTAKSPARSSRIVYETRTGSNDRVWVINQDNDSVTVIDAVLNSKIVEIPVGTAPRSIAISPDGRVWVSNKSSSTVSIIDPAGLSVMQTLAMPYASAPYGIVFSPVANEAFVVLEASGQLLKLDAGTGNTMLSASTGPNPRHVAIDSSGSKIYVSRFITPRQPGEDTAVIDPNFGGVKHGGEILVFNAADLTSGPTVVLQHSDKADAENQGGGVPNYLGAVSISPDGVRASIPSKMDNIARGTLRSGANINFQNTVRAITSVINVASDTEDYSRRIDHDNASVASEVVFDRFGIYEFATLETSNEIAVIDTHAGFQLFRINTGQAPQGIAISADGLKLFVSNFMDRSVEIFDLTDLQTQGLWNASSIATVATVANEKLTAEVLLGKQLFYNAKDDRLARDNYLSCASCHNDGGYDGRTWDLTGMNEGLRNTITLRGTAASHGRLHWSENFDEVQDFEGQIRVLSEGTGLMSDTDFNSGTHSDPLGDPKTGLSADLDALAAYVASLDTIALSPFRNSNGTLTTAGENGREIFRAENCAACHSGSEFTDSDLNVLHDVGTIKPASGQRLGGPLTGIDTPTLRGVAFSSPYLHDGSALTLSDAISAHNGVAISGQDMADLVAYLQQIDENEIDAPVPNTAPSVTNPGAQSTEVGTSVNLPIVASDIDGDTLSYAASGLPSGLSIASGTGVISGTPTTAASYNVSVTVSDGSDSSNVSFSWEVTAFVDTTAPTAPGKLTSSIVGGVPRLTWIPSTDNVGVSGYIVYRSGSNGTLGSEIGRTTVTNYSDTTAKRGQTYYYRIVAFDEAGNLSPPSGSKRVRIR